MTASLGKRLRTRTGAGDGPAGASASRMDESAFSTEPPSRGRPIGSLASIRPTSSSSAGASEVSRSGAGLDEASAFASGNGSFPESISKSMTPSAKTSVRSSSGAPAICSGAM